MEDGHQGRSDAPPKRPRAGAGVGRKTFETQVVDGVNGGNESAVPDWDDHRVRPGAPRSLGSKEEPERSARRRRGWVGCTAGSGGR
jgi:hypothetical protein